LLEIKLTGLSKDLKKLGELNKSLDIKSYYVISKINKKGFIYPLSI